MDEHFQKAINYTLNNHEKHEINNILHLVETKSSKNQKSK